MTQKEKDLEALKEATIVYYNALKKFQKAQPYTPLKSVLNKAMQTVKLLALKSHANLTDNKKFAVVKIANPKPVEQPREIEQPEPEESVVLADNAESPKAVKEQRKKRGTGKPKRKRGPNKKK